MADSILPQPQPEALDRYLREQARTLRDSDKPPADRAAWERRRAALREALFQAMGLPRPQQPCPLEPRVTGELKRPGYRIEKLTFQTLPDVWATATAYVPDAAAGGRKAPAVLAVHGHWAGARRDPTVQARCLGLVKLGFFALALDAFGAGERYTKPARGTYHGGLYGATLWPAGLTLLGQQVHDNRRAVDYLRTRPEVDGDRLGVTGASGGGNQSMYAGALDERLRAVVPVCSVGNYQAYLHAACCVCEVLPGALGFCEEGEVLGLVAPRALLVISATRDAFQFSVGEATKSIASARPIFEVMKAGDRLQHLPFESGHDYSRPMREAMYGWMTRWLKNEGDGAPIPEPEHQVETPEDLAVFPGDTRPKAFLFPPSLAGREAGRLLARHKTPPADHREAWEAQADALRRDFRERVIGPEPAPPRREPELRPPVTEAGVQRTPVVVESEPGVPLPCWWHTRLDARGPVPVCLVLHLDGKAAALQHPLVPALLDRGWSVLAPDLRGTGETAPAGGAVAGAPDHNAAEHAAWLGRPLLGRWVVDVGRLLEWAQGLRAVDRRRLAVAGVGQAGVVALMAAALLPDQVASAAVLDAPASLVTDEPYPAGTRMALLAPGLFRAGDLPHAAALVAPRRLLIAGPISVLGPPLAADALAEAYRYPRAVYQLLGAADRLTTSAALKPAEVAAAL